MPSRGRQQKETKKTDYAAQSPKDLNDESVDDLLENVDQFIQGVYRDLSIIPPLRNVSSRDTTSVGATSLADGSFPNESASEVSPTTRRNMDAEIERINQICDNVDQNLRSIGLYMNNASDRSTSTDISNSNLPPSTPTSHILSHDRPPLPTIVNNCSLLVDLQRRRSSPIDSVSVHVIDLSETQTPEVPRQPVHLHDDDDDVILVSANIHPVVDLCTPGGHQEAPIPRTYRNLNRRRLSQQDDGCQEGPSSTRRRLTEYSTSALHSHKTSEPSNVDTLPAASERTPFMCSVCMESCLQRQPTSTRCGHVFCKECIEHAIIVTHKCPLCNKKISRNHIFRIYI